MISCALAPTHCHLSPPIPHFKQRWLGGQGCARIWWFSYAEAGEMFGFHWGRAPPLACNFWARLVSAPQTNMAWWPGMC